MARRHGPRGCTTNSSPGTLATPVGVVLVLAPLAQALPSPWNDDIAKFLPGGIGASLFSVRSLADRLSPGAALVVALVWLVGTFAIATVLIGRRDA